ncbi:unnamed protein product [Closterium sp. Naga37s-1]|nr:unnamed protein product [Closterium sp. Naga37s-1]
MALPGNPATADDDDPDSRPALTGLDFLLSHLALEKAARAEPDSILTSKEPPAPVLSNPDPVAEIPAEPPVISASHHPTQTMERTVRLKQATLSFAKPSSSTANVNNSPGSSERPRPRLTINLTELIEGLYDDAIDKFKSQWQARSPWLQITKTTYGLPAFKCIVCAAYAGDGGKCGRRGKGATDLQTQSFRKHAGTAKHKLAMARQTAVQECGERQPQIDHHRATMDGEQSRVVALLDSLLFISRSDAPMGMWVKLVRYLAEKGVPGFPKKGYGTYYTTEALVAKTAVEKVPEFSVIDTVIRTVAEHLGRSGPWHQRFTGLQELDYASVHAQIKCTTSHIESRYVDCGDDFGGGVSELLSPFIARHGPGGNREVKVEGVDSDGRPARFKFMLHEDELEEWKGPGTHDDCMELCTEFAEVIVHQLEHRLGDLDGMSGVKLFLPDEYPLDRVERKRRCLQWLQSLVTLFKADLTEEIVPGKPFCVCL